MKKEERTRATRPLSPGVVVDKIRAINAEEQNDIAAACQKATLRVRESHAKRIKSLLDRCSDSETARRMLEAAGEM